MKSVGEVMAIGRTFDEALGKAMRSLENGRGGLGADGKDVFDEHKFDEHLAVPNETRIFYVAEAFRRGRSVDERPRAHPHRPVVPRRRSRRIVAGRARHSRPQRSTRSRAEDLREAKRTGLSDVQIAHLTGSTEASVRAVRKALGVRPTFKSVDTCAAEFAAFTPYYYKTYEDEDEVAPSDKPKAMILGAGPNRIGQGIEFDYCCVHAALRAVTTLGYETIMVNCNPETVSTDYDTSDRLYFEPLTFEDVMDIVEAEKPAGVRRDLRRADAAQARAARSRRRACRSWARSPRRSTSPRTAGASRRCSTARHRLPGGGHRQQLRRGASRSRGASASRCSCGRATCSAGAAWSSPTTRSTSSSYMAEAARVSPDHPVLLDRFLEGAIEVDVDAVCDGDDVYIGGVMEHIEEAGIHSGDSACCIPPFTLGAETSSSASASTRARSRCELGVRGLMNVQFAVKDERVYVLEVNPRASPHRAVREQGDRRAARQGRGARHGRARSSPRWTCPPRTASSAASASRRRSCRSAASPAPTRCSARR